MRVFSECGRNQTLWKTGSLLSAISKVDPGYLDTIGRHCDIAFVTLYPLGAAFPVPMSSLAYTLILPKTEADFAPVAERWHEVMANPFPRRNYIYNQAQRDFLAENAGNIYRNDEMERLASPQRDYPEPFERSEPGMSLFSPRQLVDLKPLWWFLARPTWHEFVYVAYIDGRKSLRLKQTRRPQKHLDKVLISRHLGVLSPSVPSEADKALSV